MEFNKKIEIKLEQTLNESVFQSVLDLLEQNYIGYARPEYADIAATMGVAWVIQKGKYSGTWPKRFSKWLKEEYSIVLPSTLVASVGNMVKAALIEESTYIIDFTDTIDWNPGEFGDKNSCYWTVRTRAKDIIKENKGFAIRLFEKDRYEPSGYKGVGRAWILPIVSGDEIIYSMWNGYGRNISLFAALFATHMKLNYRTVILHNNGTPDGTVWINDEIGILFGDNKTISQYDKFDMNLYEGVSCGFCENNISESNMQFDDINRPICQNCFESNFSWCSNCGAVMSLRSSIHPNEREHDICVNCAAIFYFRSSISYEYFLNEERLDVLVKFIPEWSDKAREFQEVIAKKELDQLLNNVTSRLRTNNITEISINGTVHSFNILDEERKYQKLTLLKEVEYVVSV